MRLIALLFSALAFYALLRLINVEVYHFMPAANSGPEGGLIDAALAAMFGLGATLVALIFALLHFRKSSRSKSSRLLLGWCGLLLLGFLLVFLKVALT